MTGHPVRPDAQQLARILCRHPNIIHSDHYGRAGYLVSFSHHCATCGTPVPGEDCSICQERGHNERRPCSHPAPTAPATKEKTKMSELRAALCERGQHSTMYEQPDGSWRCNNCGWSSSDWIVKEQ